MYKTLWRQTLLIWLFCFLKIPLIFWLRPRVVSLSNSQAVILMKFKRRTRNHVNSMYFGALCVGAELAGGALTMHLFSQRKNKHTFIFKDFQAEFLKRCEADVYFTCSEGQVIADAIAQAEKTSARQNVTLHVVATVPSLSGDEPVGNFKLTLSIK